MFALEVEYLMGRVFAAKFGDSSEPEWPPAPARLFSAMAAAYFENGSDVNEGKALVWLERCGPPRIRAGVAGEPTKVQVYVPTNYAGDHLPVVRGKQPRYFPAQGPSSAKVSFVWPDAEAAGPILDAIESLADRTTSLGRASSLVWMKVSGEPEGEDDFIPDADGGHVLRVPAPGRLEELRSLYAANRRPTAGAPVHYRKREEPQTATTQGSDFGHIVFMRKIAGPGLPIEATLTVTNAARNALISLAARDETVSQLIHGHGDQVHCAVIAIPFTGQAHADGHLLGLGVVLPANAEIRDRRQVVAVCGDLVQNGLQIPDVGYWSLEPVEAFSAQVNLRAQSWTGPSRRWQTVTPILLDRFPKKKGPTAEQIVAVACERIGLPAPISVEMGEYSNLAGVAPAPAFRLRRKADERPRWGVHATITFGEPVRGPVLLGAGRYFGLGLLRPEPRKDRD